MLNTRSARYADFMKVDPFGEQPVKLLIMKIKKNANISYHKAPDTSTAPVRKYKFENSGSQPTHKSKPATRKTISCPGNLPCTRNQSSRHCLIIKSQQQPPKFFREKNKAVAIHTSYAHKLQHYYCYNSFNQRYIQQY